jgi:hypothetical protein
MKKFIALVILLIIPVAVCSQSIGGYYGPAVSPYLVYDTFTGADTTQLQNHTPEIGGAWTANAGVTIVSNKIQSTGDYNVIIDSGQANHYITVDHLPSNGGCFSGPIVRYSDDSNYWLINMYPYGSGAFEIEEMASGSFTKQATVAAGLTRTNYNVTVTSIGATITGTVPGYTISYDSASSNQTQTKVGIRVRYCSSSFTISDNFFVSRP